jgi:hypothetical protein
MKDGCIAMCMAMFKAVRLRTCGRRRNRARARGVGKETGAWATFCGRGPVALGRPEVIALFFIYSKTFQIALN